ncbi:NB-ARC domain-containing protein [Actinomadura flavalba]|uniref:NB-ARC domain-containing protein n=1 Tax=Actinomadura flavalba TaxID=1120938 RepID=UPI00036BB28B|nr:NB-ARC domain-containing protein [Actinomadura flavalba]
MDARTVDLQILGPVRLLVNGEPTALQPRLLAVLAIAAVSDGKATYTDLDERLGPITEATFRYYRSALRKAAGFDIVRQHERSVLELGLQTSEVDYWRSRKKFKEISGLPADRQYGPLLAGAELWRGPPLSDLDQQLVFTEVLEIRRQSRKPFLDLIRICAELEGAEQAIEHAEHADRLFGDDHEIRRSLWHLWAETGRIQTLIDDQRRREEQAKRRTASKIAELEAEKGRRVASECRDLEAERDEYIDSLRADLKAFCERAREVANVAPLRLPHQLPAIRARLRDRDDALTALQELLSPDSGVRVMTVYGLGGQGKTELVVTWAHSVAGHFPDGVLYANLRGHSPVGAPMDRDAVLAMFVEALGISGTKRSGDALLAAYRTAVNTRALLVVLDNARDHRHVADLVAASGRSRTVITTRTDVAGRAMTEGARVLPLGPITLDGCLDMLRELVGAARVDSGRSAARALMETCHGMPLAAWHVAGHVRWRRHDSLEDVLARLDSEKALLGVTSEGETALRDSLSLSYTPLSPEAAAALHVIAIHPGPTITLDVVAYLSGTPEQVARQATDELLYSNLLYQSPDRRFELHDLVRAFALERAVEERSGGGVDAVRERLLQWLLASARQCDRALSSGRELPDDLLPEGSAPLPEPEDDAAGRQWFDREHDTVLAVLDSPDFRSFEPYRWRLPLALCSYQTRSGAWSVAARHLETACEIDKSDLLDPRDRDRYQAVCSRMVGNLRRKLGQYEFAAVSLRKSITLAEGIGSSLESAHGHQHMGVLQEEMSQWEQALHHATTAGRLYEELEDERGIAATLPTIINCHLKRGEIESALEKEAFAVDLMTRASTPYNQGALHRVLMECHLRVGNHAQAVAHGESARACYVDSGASPNEAQVLTGLARAYRAAGRAADERAALDAFMGLYEGLGRGTHEVKPEDRKAFEAARRRRDEVTRDPA